MYLYGINIKSNIDIFRTTCKSIKVFVTRNVNVQFKAVAMLAAAPRILLGKTSPIISQGMGPKPREKLTTYTISAMSGIHPGSTVPDFSTEFIEVVWVSLNSSFR